MNVALLYFTAFFAEYWRVSAQDNNSVTGGNCRSVVPKPLRDGNCECLQQLLEIRCRNLTHVPTFPVGSDSVFSGVYMSNQPIRRLEAYAFANLSTRRLVLNFNDIEDRLDAAAFRGNFSEVIEELYLGACRLRGLPSGLLDNMHNLTVLHLWHNSIRHLPADLLADCVSLRELIASHNLIASLDANTFIGLRNLRRLDLDYNNISALSRDVFNGLTKLQVRQRCTFGATSGPCRIHALRTIAVDVPVAWASVTRLRPANMAERIDVLSGVSE